MIFNGCDLDIFKFVLREFLKLKGIKLMDKVVVFIGVYGIVNGLDVILDVVNELKNRGRSDIVLVFIGDGKMKFYLMDWVKREKLDSCWFYDLMFKKELNIIVVLVDVGLMVLVNVFVFYYGILFNKFFDYILLGLVVLNNYFGWLVDMIKKNDLGVVVLLNNV